MRLAACYATTVALGAVFLFVACTTDNVGPTGNATQSQGRDSVLVIYGYVTDDFNQPLSGVDVEWRCTTHGFIGEDETDEDGRYDITADPWYGAHDGDAFVGSATETGYQTGYNYINPFHWYEIPYQRDFVLVPEKRRAANVYPYRGDLR